MTVKRTRRAFIYQSAWRALCGIVLLFVVAAAAAQPSPRPAPGPQGEPSEGLREQLWWIPVPLPHDPAKTVLLETTLYRPSGDGPFPLAILNHGSPRDGSKRREEPRTRWSQQSAWFVKQGFAVAIPMRRGYARSEGDWAEGYGSCNAPDYVNSGLNGAWDIVSAMTYLRQQPFIDAGRVLLVGQSAGGWGVVAASAANPEGVIGIVNFAGGRGSPKAGENCAPERLASAASQWGKSARIPSLWVYTENDGFFGPALSRRLVESYTAGGAPVRYHLMPAFSADGHNLFHRREGLEIWVPLVARFLEQVGLGSKSEAHTTIRR